VVITPSLQAPVKRLLEDVVRALCNAFVRTAERPSVPEMVANYRELRRLIPHVLSRAGTFGV